MPEIRPSPVIPVILSGGTGTRLWPASRESLPKQLLPLISDRTMLVETALRAPAEAGFAPPIVVCNEAHRFLVGEQLREAGITGARIVLEPEGGTARLRSPPPLSLSPRPSPMPRCG